MQPIIKLVDFRRTYRNGSLEVHAVRGVTLDIFPGEFVAIMGASGSGKSTLMNAIGCLDRPTSGRYELDGVDVGELDRDELADLRNSKLGFVFQGFNLLPRTSALENVELPLLYCRPPMPADEQQERALAALDLVGLGDRADHYPNQLSGGQQQRVAIARALVNEPRVLLADEPTGNLDMGTADVVFGELLTLVREHGVAALIATHNPELAARMDRTLTLREGHVIEGKG